jgi:hypothetical protein
MSTAGCLRWVSYNLFSARSALLFHVANLGDWTGKAGPYKIRHTKERFDPSNPMALFEMIESGEEAR